MSYARWSPGSDVYVFTNVGGFIECCGCSLSEHSFQAFSTDEMLAHLEEHKAVGHDVPSYCIEGLEADREENDSFIAWTREHGYVRTFSKPYGKHHSFEDIACFRCHGEGEEHQEAVTMEFAHHHVERPAYDGPCRVCQGTGKRRVGRDFEHFFTAVGWRHVRQRVT